MQAHSGLHLKLIKAEFNNRAAGIIQIYIHTFIHIYVQNNIGINYTIITSHKYKQFNPMVELLRSA